MLDLTIYAVPFFFLLIAFEILIGNWNKNQSYSKSDTIASLSLFAGNALVILGTKSLFFIFYAQLYEYRLIRIGTNLGVGSPILLLLILYFTGFIALPIVYGFYGLPMLITILVST